MDKEGGKIDFDKGNSDDSRKIFCRGKVDFFSKIKIFILSILTSIIQVVECVCVRACIICVHTHTQI